MPRTETAIKVITDARRREIMKVASRLFLDRGFDLVRISDIAEAAGISQGLTYRYFSDKQELMLSLVEEGIQEVSLVLRLQEKATGSAKARLHKFVELMLNSIYANPERQQIVLQGIRFPGKIKDRVEALMNEMEATVLALIAAAQAEGSIAGDDPRTLSFLLLSALLGIGSGVATFGVAEPSRLPTWTQVVRLCEPGPRT